MLMWFTSWMRRALTPAPLPQAGEGSKHAGGHKLLGSRATTLCESSDAFRANSQDLRLGRAAQPKASHPQPSQTLRTPN
ncbi:hypothetical protein CBM2587_B10099 [Cupriavidus taiwanensis]|uniref:Uncharacterized protein n=1 Tax=Cupriavidus taiwanensis TaxID=164546 RepID=A0A375BX81_9BURK|nr:hypothetical protein CBM2587_B10099 [Cupriavidus taiwanensis]